MAGADRPPAALAGSLRASRSGDRSATTLALHFIPIAMKKLQAETARVKYRIAGVPVPFKIVQVLLAASALLFSTIAFPMDVELSPGLMRLEGEIQPGDAEKVARAMGESFHKKIGFGVLELNSRGGSVIDAVRIAELFELHPVVIAIRKKAICASSCVFILLAGTHRIASGKVGLHRPYLSKDYASGIGVSEASSKQAELMRRVNSYLVGENFPRRLIDEMMARPSNDIYWLTREELELIGKYAPGYEEALISRCSYSRKWEKQLINAMDRAEYLRDMKTLDGLTAERDKFFDCDIRVSRELKPKRIEVLEKLASGWRPWTQFQEAKK